MSIYSTRKSTAWIAVHCAATKPSMNIGAKEIRQWHREKGWIDIGYHFVIRRDGTVETGRPIDTVGAHVEGYNSNSVGICLVGGINDKGAAENNFTPAQFAALALKLCELKTKYPAAVIQGHRDFPKVAKACPSFDVRKWINETGVFSTSAAPAEPDTPAIEIKAGDTLWSIAKRYATTVDTLLKLNGHLNPAKLQVGQFIRLP